MLKNNYRKLERKKIITWMLMWLNMSTVTLNAALQLLVIYRLQWRLTLMSTIVCFIHWRPILSYPKKKKNELTIPKTNFSLKKKKNVKKRKNFVCFKSK